MFPGTAVALLLTDAQISESIIPTAMAFCSLCLIASANYVINEWLDREFDKHHPIKKNRPSASGKVRGFYVAIEYSALVAGGLALAAQLPVEFIYFSILLLISGIAYNVTPIRTKDRVYLDVLSEAINNPLRFMLGWSAIVSSSLPPSSILLAYWMGGAFLMAIKRFAEYRHIGSPDQAGLYRRSFRFYTEESILVSAFFYGLCSSLFLGIFLIKYRIEFLFSFPFFALLFAWYLSIGLRSSSTAQTPEKLYRERRFIAYLVLLVCILIALFVVDIPYIDGLLEPSEY